MQRRVCFIMNNPRGRLTSAATHKPSHFRVEMSEIMKIQKRRKKSPVLKMIRFYYSKAKRKSLNSKEDNIDRYK